MEETTANYSTAKLAGLLGAFIRGIWIAARKFVKAQDAVPLDHRDALERRIAELESSMEQALTRIDSISTDFGILERKVDRKDKLSQEQLTMLKEKLELVDEAIMETKRVLSAALGK